MRRDVFLIGAMCLAEVLGMAGFAAFPALLPVFQADWGLSNIAAGWINAIFYAGYLAAVLILVSLTDRVDPRRILLFSMALTFLSLAGFGLLAGGFWSALLWRALAGVGLAGTYMPGLKLLGDLVGGPAQSRAVSFYTSSFGIGSSLSYYFSGKAEPLLGWPGTFLLASAGPALAFGLVLLLVPAAPQQGGGEAVRLSPANFIRVLRNRRALGYMLAYAAHNWELFGLRSWIVAYLTFLKRLRPMAAMPFTPATLASIVNLMGLPSSVLGNEAASRFNRPLVAGLIMAASAALAFSIGATASMSGWAVTLLFLLYGCTVSADSASITTGAMAEADPALRGTTMAVHSSIGFMGSFLGPLVFGLVLDLSGRGATANSWWLAFGSLGLAVAAGPIMLFYLSSPDYS